MGSGSRTASWALVCVSLLAAPTVADAAPRTVERGDQLRVPGARSEVAEVRLRARAVGCRRASATLLVGGRAAGWVTFRRRMRRAAIPVDPVTTASRLRVLVGGCDLRVRRVKASPPRAADPAPAPLVPVPAAPVPLGAAINTGGLGNPVYRSTVLSTFRSITPENELKMTHTQPRPGYYDWSAADRIVNFAGLHGLAIRGHALIFGSATPSWVRNQQVPLLIEQTLRDRVRTVIERYRSSIRVWDVVNEAFATNGGWRRNAFYDALGPNYVNIAYRTARETDPTAKLYYNEIGAEYDNPKQRSVMALVRRLRAERLIDGVGIQMHVSIQQSPTYDELVALMQSYAAMGLEVELTEMDVSAAGPLPLDQRLERQADVYATAGRACRAVPACKRVTVWGVSDRVTWLEPAEIPLLFDADYKAKPALDALRTALTAPAV